MLILPKFIYNEHNPNPNPSECLCPETNKLILKPTWKGQRAKRHQHSLAALKNKAGGLTQHNLRHAGVQDYVVLI